MKLSTLAWCAFFAVCLWWICNLSQAMFSAHYAYYDLKNSQAKEMLFGR